MKSSCPTFLATILLFSTAYGAKPAKNWQAFCEDRERARHQVECWRPPGDYQAVWQMQGEKRSYYLKQAKRVVAQRLRTDQQQAQWRYRAD